MFFELPGFSLTERSGQTVTLGTLKGKVWVADFIFTTCQGPCPMMTRRMAGLQSNLAGEAGVRFLTITVDPRMDTPDRLRRYADQFRAPKDRWLFLTGEREAIYKLSTEGFRLAAIVDDAAAAPSDHPILHSTKFVLVDRQARIRGYYDGTSEEDVKRLETDARRLAAEGTE
ncbi:MAG: SCO family protein [Phycisphaerae bacterium]